MISSLFLFFGDENILSAILQCRRRSALPKPDTHTKREYFEAKPELKVAVRKFVSVRTKTLPGFHKPCILAGWFTVPGRWDLTGYKIMAN